MDIIACLLELLRQNLSFSLGVLKLHANQRGYVVAEFNVEMQYFLFPRAEKNTVSLVKCEIVLLVVKFKNLHVIL